MGNLVSTSPNTTAADNVDETWRAIRKAIVAGDLNTFSSIFHTGSWFVNPDIIKEENACHVRQRGRSYERRAKWLMGIAAKHKELRILRYLTTQPLVEDIVKERPSSIEGYEMISWALQGGSPECVSVLLELNSDLVHCRSPHHINETPLLDAMHLKHIECLRMTELLLSYGADPNARSVMMDTYGLQRPEIFRYTRGCREKYEAI